MLLAQDQSYGLVIIDGIRDLLLDINNAENRSRSSTDDGMVIKV